MLAILRPLALALAVASPGLAQDAPKPTPTESTAPSEGTLEERKIEIDEADREYLLHLPGDLDTEGKQKVPLVIMMHGRSSNMRAASSAYYGWRKLADDKGFVVAFPNAVGRPKSWRPAWGRESADAPFLSQLIDALIEELPIDPKQVFLTGHSSGGIMSFSFAATHSDKVAAIGPMAGTIGFGKVTIPKPKSPVPVISIHGTKDRIVPYDEEGARGAVYGQLVTTPKSMAFWVEHNRCAAEAERTTTKDGKVHVDVWKPKKGGARVELHSVVGAGHGWPGGRRGAYPATQKIWKFFERVMKEAVAENTSTEADQKKDDGERRAA